MGALSWRWHQPATSSELQCRLTTEDITVGRPVVCRLGWPAVVLISVCSQNQPEEMTRDERKNNNGFLFFVPSQTLVGKCWVRGSSRVTWGINRFGSPNQSVRRSHSHLSPHLITAPLSIFIPPTLFFQTLLNMHIVIANSCPLFKSTNIPPNFEQSLRCTQQLNVNK